MSCLDKSTLAGLSELKWRDQGSVWGATRSKNETNSWVEPWARLGLQWDSPVEKELVTMTLRTEVGLSLQLMLDTTSERISFEVEVDLLCLLQH